MGKGRGWGDLLSRRRRAASTAEITPPLPLPIEGRGRASTASRDHSLKVRKGLRSAGHPSGV
ncbi:hypothetical protein CA606_20420 [Caulobacter vibrioides]|uniref:Uncharacterized protein n=1 Tax=Caulobacter vibrioides TaxID=155892 RepID=A0A2S1B7Q6_CAUVI|nr:hypothetical protein [Caulobacter vibrioides]AWC68689.1 hypothetical protein CA606_20420 [Caulobacter vibrioides]